MTIGILGGGQLGRMLALAGIPMGLKFRFLDPSADACAGQGGSLIVGSYTDEKLLRQFADSVDIITYEFENIPVDSIRMLEGCRTVHPSAAALEHVQDRLQEKNLCATLGIPTAEYASVETPDQLRAALQHIGFPSVLKTRSLGYDGKGQLSLSREEDFHAAYALCSTGACIVEKRIPFTRELSLIATRGSEGSVVHYPLTENVHSEGILRVSRAPAFVESSLAEEATSFATLLLQHLDYVGTMTIEFFEYEGHLLLNELAPRVHNSGHWTIEGAETSQFENHLRAITGLPLGSVSPRGFSAMVNIIGSYPDLAEITALKGVHVHFYEKTPRPKRKLGHITICHPDKQQVESTLEKVRLMMPLPICI